MLISLLINDRIFEVESAAGESLLSVLRRLGFFSVKHGCETGECGACAVLLDGKTVNSCVMLAAQAVGHILQTIESIGEHPEQGWKTTQGLHPLQQAFVETGAVQCGYCTPAQILAAKELLDRNPNPTEAEVRQALAGVLCRCTGYLKPVQAVLRAAAVLRGEAVEPLEGGLHGDEGIPAPPDWFGGGDEGGAPEKDLLTPATFPGGAVQTRTRLLPRITLTPESEVWSSVGKPEKKVDAVKLVQG
ncbi:MAG: (2Fe-2S)-binding protein, partial [Anaerolineae bacterium]|nr:(2Fe-2S)-binding protein [Anaerolineae bacterium]